MLRIINEPTAASLAYGLGGKDVDQTIAVYDLGGGTFDLSILRVQAGTFRVLATHGDTFLGGDDIDRLLIQVARRTLDQAGVATDDPRLRAQLRQAAERAKIELSSQDEAVLRLQDPSRGINLELGLTRADLGVTSSSRTSLSPPARMSAWTAAPRATTWSGSRSVWGARPNSSPTR